MNERTPRVLRQPAVAPDGGGDDPPRGPARRWLSATTSSRSGRGRVRPPTSCGPDTDALTALEFDPDLAAALAQRLAGTNVDVVCGDATAMDLPDRPLQRRGLVPHAAPHPDRRGPGLRSSPELARVLEPGGVLVAADGIENEGTRLFHVDDIYNPIDPAELPDRRWLGVGFTSIDVRVYDLGWICTAAAAYRAERPGRPGGPRGRKRHGRTDDTRCRVAVGTRNGRRVMLAVDCWV